jgi:hypothetical protein
MKDEDRKWFAGLGVALLNDVNDYVGFGALPLVGDALDMATSAALYPLIGTKNTAFTLIEFIPGADYLPTYTSAVLYSWHKDDESELLGGYFKDKNVDGGTSQKGMKEVDIS